MLLRFYYNTDYSINESYSAHQSLGSQEMEEATQDKGQESKSSLKTRFCQ